jgi:hypothetical protein
VYETEDNFIFNSDLIDMYMNMLIRYDMYHEGIRARKDYIKYLHKTGTIDHQSRRAYIEIICLHVLCDEKYKIKQVLDEMSQSDPASFGKDEYNVGQGMLDYIAQ